MIHFNVPKKDDGQRRRRYLSNASINWTSRSKYTLICKCITWNIYIPIAALVLLQHQICGFEVDRFVAAAGAKGSTRR